VLSVVTQGVSDALHDEEFIGEFRNVIKDCLSDGEIYRSGARGMISAAFGSKKKDDNEKSDLSGKKSNVKQITDETL